MNKNLHTMTGTNTQLGCFGDYSKDHPLCSKHCVLRLRCAIELEQNMRMELLEDLMDSENLLVTIQ